MERWSGKVAVVTGASSGIGAAVAVALANAGFRVVGLARRAHLVDELKSQVTGSGSLQSRGCDLTKLEELNDTFSWVEETLGGVDVLINNAGVNLKKHITEFSEPTLTDAEVLSVIDLNYRALVMCSRRALASMKTRGVPGHVVNINSIAGHYVPWAPRFNVYPSTKYAVTAFTEGLFNELAHAHQHNVKITSLSPGMVATEMTKNENTNMQDKVALRPQDVADAVLYVLSTPPTVNISELTIQPVGEIRL